MGKRKIDINKFSFAQLCSNSDGKTSGSGTVGILICTIGCLTFLIGCVDKIFFSKDVDILVQTIIFTGIGAALLGVRKAISPAYVKEEEIEALNEASEGHTEGCTCTCCPH
jgi:hypothetical protein